jgi:hypothetical protein
VLGLVLPPSSGSLEGLARHVRCCSLPLYLAALGGDAARRAAAARCPTPALFTAVHPMY